MSLEGRLEELREVFRAAAKAWANCRFLACDSVRRASNCAECAFNWAFSTSSCRQRFFQPKSIRIVAGRALGENQDASHIASAFRWARTHDENDHCDLARNFLRCKSSWRQRNSCPGSVLFQ